ncbi:copine-8-like [Tigriopus californicus]|uniref:copine-8-like n=1 Tax=Tigriopus californicus TaxID=6832 RepID=UPI0027DA02E1|nr:copine-8-like [Tigriopus californicus]
MNPSYNPNFPAEGATTSISTHYPPPSAPHFMPAPPHVSSGHSAGPPMMPSGPPPAMHRPPFNSNSSLGSMELPTSTLEIRVRCDRLADQDVFSKSDPFCVMFQKPRGQHAHWVEVGRTEVIKNNLSPEWQTKFIVNYSFEERQEVKFEVYDWDQDSRNLSAHDFLGRCQTTLGQIVAASGHQFTAVLQDSPGRATSHIFITTEELGANKEVAYIQLAAENLDKMDFFGKSDPFFVISKGFSNGRFVVVKKSEVIKKTLNPSWAQFSVPVRDLCNNNYERPLKIDVYDWNASGKDDFIGSFMTSLRSLSSAAIERTKYPCINEKKVGKKKYTNSGLVYVKSYRTEKQLTFLDYIQGGTSMNFSVAIDFTASNGNPQHPSSLHHLRPGFLDNQYTAAIRACGEIIEDYDSDKMFPALGFGARVPPSGMVSHEFYLNLRDDNPYCARVDGLIQAYYNALQRVTLYGPTNFAPVIQHVTRFAQTYQDGRQYFVLLIITDGIITDMDMTKQAIIEASKYPMSIIIVGVGEEDFSAMEELDSDDKLLSYYNQKAQRDIVQFVELRKFLSPRDQTWDKAMLAKEVMAEVPGQVVDWMKFKGVKPIET